MVDSTGFELLNQQLLNLLQYIKNVHPELMEDINKYKLLVNTAILYDSTIIGMSIIENLNDDIISAVDNYNQEKLISFLHQMMDWDVKHQMVDISSIIQFILTTWENILDEEQKRNVWKFLRIILKIALKLKAEAN